LGARKEGSYHWVCVEQIRTGKKELGSGVNRKKATAIRREALTPKKKILPSLARVKSLGFREKGGGATEQ